MEKPLRARDRTRALFALVVGAVVVLAGALGRLVPPEGWKIELISVACALVVSAIGALVLARPRPGQWLSIGVAPLASALGVAMLIIGGLDPGFAAALLPAAVSAAGGATVIAAFVRWALASSAYLHAAPPLDPAHRYAVTHGAETSPTMRPARAIQAGDRVEVARSHTLPVDGTIVSGEGFADERALTRSDAPIAKASGDPVLAGTTTDVEMLVIAARAPFSESLIQRTQRHTADLLERVAHQGEAAGGGATSVVLALIVLIGAIAVAYASRAWGLGVILPGAAGALLAVASGAPLVTHRRALARAVSRAVRRGIIPATPRAMIDLSRVGRWQVDPRLLASGGSVDFVGEVDPMLPVAAALLEGAEGPEVRAVRAEISPRGLRHRVAAAVRRSNGTWHGTVSGERWCLGPIRAVTEEARVQIPRELQASLQFLEERSAVTWLLAKTGDEVIGGIGIQLLVEPDVAKAARALQASVMPGAGDGVASTLAESAQIARDGPPLGARDASLVAAGSPAPSAGLVVEAVEPRPSVTLGAPITCFIPSLDHLPRVMAQTRGTRQRARWAGLFGAVLPMLAVVPLATFHVLDPVLGTIAAITGLAMAMRASSR